MQLNFEAYRHFFSSLCIALSLPISWVNKQNVNKAKKKKKCLELEFWIFLRLHPLRKLFTDDALQKVGGSEIFLKRLESNQSVTQKWWSHATNSSPKCCSLSIITHPWGVLEIYLLTLVFSFLKKWGAGVTTKLGHFSYTWRHKVWIMLAWGQSTSFISLFPSNRKTWRKLKFGGPDVTSGARHNEKGQNCRRY